MNDAWTVIRSKPRSEQQAEQALQRLNYTTYYPRHRKFTFPNGRNRAPLQISAPYWPGYIFAKDWHGWPHGQRFHSAVIGTARFGQQIASISDADMRVIRAAEEAGAFDEPDPHVRAHVRVDLKTGDAVELEAHGRRIEAILLSLSANGTAVLRSLEGVRFTAQAHALRLTA